MWFDKQFIQQWGGKEPTFKQIMSLQGKIFREPKGAGRRTLKFTKNGQFYFAKLHWGVGWKEIFKNLVSFRLPILGAQNEWLAIQAFNKIGIETMHLSGYAQQGSNPAKQQSFVITQSLEESISLEDYCANWQTNPPKVAVKYQLIRRIAEMTRLMHDNGMNHRDYYICHFLLMPWDGTWQNLHLHLIDLHRVQKRSKVPFRWRVKDLGALWFSAMEIGLKPRDYLRFIKIYNQGDLRQNLADKKLWRAVEKRALALWKTR
jgi:heptose I phosphotransferase